MSATEHGKVVDKPWWPGSREKRNGVVYHVSEDCPMVQQILRGGHGLDTVWIAELPEWAHARRCGRCP